MYSLDLEDIDYLDHYYNLDSDKRQASYWLPCDSHLYEGMNNCMVVIEYIKPIEKTHNKTGYLPLAKYLSKL